MYNNSQPVIFRNFLVFLKKHIKDFEFTPYFHHVHQTVC